MLVSPEHQQRREFPLCAKPEASPFNSFVKTTKKCHVPRHVPRCVVAIKGEWAFWVNKRRHAANAFVSARWGSCRATRPSNPPGAIPRSGAGEAVSQHRRSRLILRHDKHTHEPPRHVRGRHASTPPSHKNHARVPQGARGEDEGRQGGVARALLPRRASAWWCFTRAFAPRRLRAWLQGHGLSSKY